MTKIKQGMKFGKLTAIEPLVCAADDWPRWLCACDCGNLTKVISYNLTKGNSKSCGCVGRTKCAKRMKTLNHKHGATNTELFGIWGGIVERTTWDKHPRFYLYGGRGIGIHPHWLIFENFKRDVGERPSKLHTIDRIDNNKGYEPGNVRWATMYEQARNRRSNKWVLVNGKSMILTDAAKVLGIGKSTASRWLQSGKLIEIAV